MLMFNHMDKEESTTKTKSISRHSGDKSRLTDSTTGTPLEKYPVILW